MRALCQTRSLNHSLTHSLTHSHSLPFHDFRRTRRVGAAALAVIGLSVLPAVSAPKAPRSMSPCSTKAGLMRFPALGKSHRIRKVFDPAKNMWKVCSEDTSLDAQGLVELERAERKAHHAKHGAMTPQFAAKIKGWKSARPLELEVTLRHRDTPPLDRTKHPVDTMKAAAKRRVEMLKAQMADVPARAEALALRHGLDVESVDGFTVRCKAEKTSKGLITLAKDPGVGSVEEYLEPMSLYTPYSSIAQSTYNPTMVSKGSPDIHIATFEDGISDGYLQCLGLWPRPSGVEGGSQWNEHDQNCWQFMVTTAPSCAHYHCEGNENGVVLYQVMQDWFVDNEIHVASKSKAASSDPLNGQQRAVDRLTYQWPYTIFCNPANNYDASTTVNWGAYNGLSVGNVQHYQEATYRMNGCSNGGNPPTRYGPNHDREMPYVVVPGTAPYPSEPLGHACAVDEWYCGTSISAPVLNGICGILRGLYGNGYAGSQRYGHSWPELVRAVVVLTAQNVDGGDWDVYEDGWDGTGAVSGAGAESFFDDGYIYWGVPGGNAQSTGGACIGTFYPADTDVQTVNVAMPATFPSGRHFRAVMLWNSNASIEEVRNDLTDVDIWTVTDDWFKFSYSDNSSIEVLDVYQDELTPGGTYPVSFQQTKVRIPSGEFSYYALAWGWVRDHAD